MNNVTITGLSDVNKILRTIAPNEAKNLMRATVQEIASNIAKDVRPRIPKDKGELAQSVFAKRERGDRETVQSTVNVDKKAFYWRFLEYGDGPDGIEHAFFLKTLEAAGADLDQKYMAIFVRKLEARLQRLAKKGAR